MVLRLYYDIMSQPSRAVLLFIRVNSIPCEEIPIALRNGEHHSEDFAALTPFKKVPVIEHDGFVLTESVAILRYLCRAFSTKGVCIHWCPTTSDDSIPQSQTLARIDEYMAWQHTNLRARTAGYFLTAVISPLLRGSPPDPERIAKSRLDLENMLDQLENVWLKKSKFIAGNDLTIADLLCVTELEQPRMAGFDIKIGRPIIAAYMELVRSRLQPHYDEIHSKARAQKEKLTSKL